MVIQWLQFFYLFYKVGFLVVKLFIFWAVCVESCQEVNQLVLVSQQDLQNWLGLIGVGYKHLDNGTAMRTSEWWWEDTAEHRTLQTLRRAWKTFCIMEHFQFWHLPPNENFQEQCSCLPWRHGRLQTVCSCSFPAACSSSALSCLGCWCSVSL